MTGQASKDSEVHTVHCYFSLDGSDRCFNSPVASLLLVARMLLVAWQLQVMGQSNGKMVHLSTQCSTHTQRRVCWQVLCRPQQCNGESWTIGLLDAMFGTDLEQSVHYYFTTEVKLSLQSFCSKLLKMVESTFSFT